MREIKFRAKRIDDGEWVYGSFAHCHDEKGNPTIIPFGDNRFFSVVAETVGQFTGLKDRKEVDSFDGDIIKYSVVEMDYQDHWGDNIPNGHYHEPLGWIIKTHIETIVFENGVFGIKGENENDPPFPLIWIDGERFDDLKAIEEWFEEEQLYTQYGFESMKQLLESLSGFEIIGNIHSNPELSEVKA